MLQTYHGWEWLKDVYSTQKNRDFGHDLWHWVQHGSAHYMAMSMYGSVWLCMAMYSYVWLCIAMYGYVWLCMAMYGYVWLYGFMDLHCGNIRGRV